MLRIEEHPEQFRILYRDFHRALVPRPFPYQIWRQRRAVNFR